MKAIVSFSALAVDDPDSLQDIVVSAPQLRPRDVLVRVLAVSVNPVDVKRRRGLVPSETPTILGHVDYLFTPHSAGGIETFAAIMRPFGHITAIDESDGLDLLPLKAKSIAWHWELMFTHSLFDYDMIDQQRLLARTATAKQVVRSGRSLSADTEQQRFRPLGALVDHAVRLGLACRKVEPNSIGAARWGSPSPPGRSQD